LGKKVKNSTATKRETVEKNSIIYAIPILFMVTLFLFAIRGMAVRTYLENMFWYTSKQLEGDIYSYFRMGIFIFVSFASFIWLGATKLCGSKTCRIYKHSCYIPMIVYSLLVLLSYAVSSYKNIAFYGFSERHEGTVVLIGYMAMLFVSMNTVYTEKTLKAIMYAFTGACLILGIWGVLQVNGIDLMNIPQWLYIPKKLQNAGNLVARNGENTVKWFFSNQNYASFFMVFPITVTGMLSVASRNLKFKAIFAAISGLMMYNLWNASSLGGMVACVVTFIAGIIVYNKNLLKWKVSVLMLLAAILISAGLSTDKIIPQLKQGAQAAANTVIKTVYAANTKNFIKIDYIKTDGANLIYSFAGNEVTIKTTNDGVEGVYDAKGNSIGLENDYFTVTTEKKDQYTHINVKTARRTWEYGIIKGEVYFASPSGKGIKLDKTEAFGFKNHENFATNRGYIWSRTLPLLKKTIIVGHGADTFAIYFPQADYAGKYNVGFYYDGVNTVVDKPHNMYLGTAVNTGILSLIALLSIYILYIIESIKTYRKCGFDSFTSIMGSALFIAILGFLVGGLVNDSTVQVTPVFYTLLGVGFAANRLLKKA